MKDNIRDELQNFFTNGIFGKNLRDKAIEKLLRVDADYAFILALSQCDDIDSADYLRRYPDVAESDMTAIMHYIKYGRKEGRSIKLIENPAKKLLTIQINDINNDDAVKVIPGKQKANGGGQYFQIQKR